MENKSTCNHTNSSVTNTGTDETYKYRGLSKPFAAEALRIRRRKCHDCNKFFITYEFTINSIIELLGQEARLVREAQKKLSAIVDIATSFQAGD
jgi:transcriptional regulator NrdR family protein